MLAFREAIADNFSFERIIVEGVDGTFLDLVAVGRVVVIVGLLLLLVLLFFVSTLCKVVFSRSMLFFMSVSI